MATMRAALSDPRLLDIEEFLRIDFGPDLRAELDAGVIRMMTGGSRRHSDVQRNVLIALVRELAGSGCRPHGSDMGVAIAENSFRYPDVSVDCGTPDDSPLDQSLRNPKVVVEVLSPSTRRYDLTVKEDEYRRLPTLDAIVMLDPDTRTVAVTRRKGEAWIPAVFVEADLELPTLGVLIPHAEIFAGD